MGVDHRENHATQLGEIVPQTHFGVSNLGLNLVLNPKLRGVPVNRVTTTQFNSAKKNKAGRETLSTRLCGDLSKCLHHVKSIVNVDGGGVDCAFCGEKCCAKCGICGFAAHNDPSKVKFKGRQCFLHMHNDESFGLGHTDQKQCFGGSLADRKKAWRVPTEEDIKRNAAHMQRTLRGPTPCSLRSAFDGATGNNDDNDNDNAEN